MCINNNNREGFLFFERNFVCEHDLWNWSGESHLKYSRYVYIARSVFIHRKRIIYARNERYLSIFLSKSFCTIYFINCKSIKNVFQQLNQFLFNDYWNTKTNLKILKLFFLLWKSAKFFCFFFLKLFLVKTFFVGIFFRLKLT